MRGTIAGCLGALLWAAVIPGAVRAGVVRVEMESLFAAHNVGGAEIQVKSCTGASGRLAVDGLDTEGEWIQVRVELPWDYCFVDSLRSAGALGLVRTYAITVAPESPTVPADGDTVTTIPGRGVG